MKRTQGKSRLFWLDVSVVCITVALVGGGLWLSFMRPVADDDTACKKPGTEQVLELAGDKFSRDELSVKRCDTVKIVNIGAENYDLAFGVHEKHVEYPGFSRQVLRPNEYLVFEATQTGTYTMHDHLRDEAKVTLEILAK